MDNCKYRAQQLALISSVVAIALAENFNADEQNVIGNMIVQIGSTILTIAAATQNCENTNTQDDAQK